MESVQIERPKRWDHPLDPTMFQRNLDWLLEIEPFASLDQGRFRSPMTLADILRNDARILRYESGDIIVREGDYGSSAFIVLRGSVRLLITRWSHQPNYDKRGSKKSWWQALGDSLRIAPGRERRNIAALQGSKEMAELGGGSTGQGRSATGVRVIDDRPRVFVQDTSAIFGEDGSEPLGAGELFGEMAAITRSPSSYTVISDGPSVLLEIRWQGLRLLRRDSNFQRQLDRRYKQANLKTHLRELELFRYVPPEYLDRIANATQLESYGDMEWFVQYRGLKKEDVQERIRREPVIVSEGAACNSLIVVRAGFARISREYGAGHRTESYLGRGQVFGLQELVHNAKMLTDTESSTRETKSLADQVTPYQRSLRAVGFTDVLKVPRREFLQYALPYIRSSELPPPIPTTPNGDDGQASIEMIRRMEIDRKLELTTELLEFLVDERVINGRQTMVIDTLRCTRCDDCVKACATVHDGNPRFERTGNSFDRFQFANACMHCVDPVCLIGCPTGAIGRDVDSGVIQINPNSCIGCKTCAESCPYENIRMVEITDTSGSPVIDKESMLPVLQATKCDMCQGLPSGPACQSACPHDALVRVDMGDLSQLAKWMKKNAA